MLAQILHDLYVPRELLDELPEDQKQLLFCKMREEQVRRYHQREEEEKAIGRIITDGNKGKKKKQVSFRLGADGNEWCWVMGEFPDNSDNKINNENMDIDYLNEQKQLKISDYTADTFPIESGVYYTVHRDQRKHIEEISNNIQEARRIFELLESETRRLALSKENEILYKQPRSVVQMSQSDFVDEIFHHEIEERAKKADQEKRETARRARDSYHRQSSQFGVCFDTDNRTTFTLQPMMLNSSNRTTPIDKKVDIELDDRETPAFPLSSTENSNEFENNQEIQLPNGNTGHQRSKPLSPITRADIHRWFSITEIPYDSFRSPTGQIYPWFHGIISRAYTEQLLLSKPVGSYLIRISEKIFGYVLSYHASDHCRHLLIEVTKQEHAYRFLGGAKKELFTSLSQLIEKYCTIPIRSNSPDILRYPCGQIDPERADYADLFVDNIENAQLSESLYISLDTTTSSLQSTTHL